jgi:IMP cyclohydrolase
MKLSEALQKTDYPGRGIFIGRSPDNGKAVIAYFLTGRSEGSRNRILVSDGDGIRTESFDASKLPDPSLYVYSAVRTCGGATVVTNGDQTDTVCSFLTQGKTFEDALRTRSFEPDPPINTPRISGIVYADGTYKLSILKSMPGRTSAVLRFFYEYMQPAAGTGHLIHTYKCDGNPVPSFEGEPVQTEISGDIESLAGEIWETLNAERKVSLYVRYIDIAGGEYKAKLINKNG